MSKWCLCRPAADDHRPGGVGWPRRWGPADPVRERGSVSIEFVGTIPILIIVAILLIEGLLLASAVEDTTKAARDSARVASRGEDGAAAARAGLPAWIRVEQVDVGAAPGCAGVCSTVEVSVPVGVPGVIELGRVTVTRSADFAAG